MISPTCISARPVARPRDGSSVNTRVWPRAVTATAVSRIVWLSVPGLGFVAAEEAFNEDISRPEPG